MFDRKIKGSDVHEVIDNGRTIEEYPDDTPYPSRLIPGWIGARPLHIVIAENPEDHVVIVVTAYEPDIFNWLPGFERRREQ
jgi:hypothetical protein